MQDAMQDATARGRAHYGEKFDPSALNPTFAPYLYSGQKIAVKIAGEVWVGTVGITTGWKPVFLLMARTNSIGSSNTLGMDAELVAVHDGTCYRTAQGKRVRLQRSPETSYGAWVVAG